MSDLGYDLARITLAVLFIAALIGTSLWVLRPFLPAVIWAAMLVVATWQRSDPLVTASGADGARFRQ